MVAELGSLQKVGDDTAIVKTAVIHETPRGTLRIRSPGIQAMTEQPTGLLKMVLVVGPETKHRTQVVMTGSALTGIWMGQLEITKTQRVKEAAVQAIEKALETL